MPSPDQISSRIRQTLRLTDPDLDTSIGTPTRSIIDAVAAEVSAASVDAYLTNYQYDIDTKIGTELDSFVELFGLRRQVARRASGLVTFERLVAASTPLIIPIGTQVSTDVAPTVIYTTVTAGVIAAGGTQVSVPVQALIAGSAGNSAAGTIRRLISQLTGISGVLNVQAITGGTDAESDESLRSRFKTTALRHYAGTEQMFRGTALADKDATAVNVIGSKKRHREQIELVNGTATSTIQNASHIYPSSPTMGSDIDAGSIFTHGVHYSFNATNPPQVTSMSTTVVPDGIYEIEFDYLPLASRNDPSNGVVNRVDIWIAGERITRGTENLVFNSTLRFSPSASHPYYTQKFKRLDESNPLEGNIFVPFGFSPVIDPAPDNTITINGVTYTKDQHFWLVQDTSAFGNSNRSFSGIEFKSTTNGLALAQPADGQPFMVEYYFNSVPRDVETAIQGWRMVTQDVWVHASFPIRLQLTFVVILSPGYTSASLITPIKTALTNFVNTITFNAVLQRSDLLGVVTSVQGIDAVRFATANDNSVTYGIQRIDPYGAVKETYAVGGRAIDVIADDDSTFIVENVQLIVRAQNTFNNGV